MSRKIISSILALCVVLTAMAGLFVIPVGAATTVTDWSAAEITLNNADDLKGFISELTGGRNFAGQTIKMANDIDLNPGWDASTKKAPTVTEDNPSPYTWTLHSSSFNGTFDGQNHTISGIYGTQTWAKHDQSLFGSASVIAGAATQPTTTLKNVKFDNSYVYICSRRSGALIKTGYDTGAAPLLLENIENNMTVNINYTDSPPAGVFVGYVGKTTVNINNCVFNGSVTSSGCTGGVSVFVGYKSGSGTVNITNCFTAGSVDGIVSYFAKEAVTYNNCYYASTATNTSTVPAGVTKVGSMVESDIVLSDAADVMAFAGLLSKGFEDFSGMTVKLGGDVDLNPGWTAPAGVVETWNGSAATNHWPLIKAKTGFAGTFDGQGHTISGLHYAGFAAGSTGNNYGIFGNLTAGKSATIKNVTFENSYALFRSWQSTGLYGAVSGALTIENVNNGINFNTYNDGSDYVSGMVGIVNSGAVVNIYNSTVSGTLSGVSSNGAANAGGFIGQSGGAVNMSGCEFSGNIKTTYTGKNVAGMVCYVAAGSVNIDGSLVTGKVEGVTAAAGFVAYVAAGATAGITNSAMYGTVTQATGVCSGFIDDNRGTATIKNVIAGGILTTNSNGNAAYVSRNPQGTVTRENVIVIREDGKNVGSGSQTNAIIKTSAEMTGVGAQAVISEMTAFAATTTGYPVLKSFVEEYTPAADDSAITDYIGFQTSKKADGKFNLRLVGSLDKDDIENYTNVGFKVVAFFENGDAVMAKDCALYAVYDSIATSYGTSNLSETGKYLFVQECINLPTAYGDITFEVTTYATDADGETMALTYRFVVDVDAIPAA